MNRYFLVEGNMVFSDNKMLTWGPFYYHSKEKAKNRIDIILKDIVNWCNLKDPSLNIIPKDIKWSKTNDRVVFKIDAWKNDTTLDKCWCMIYIEEIFFEDEDNEYDEDIEPIEPIVEDACDIDDKTYIK